MNTKKQVLSRMPKQTEVELAATPVSDIADKARRAYESNKDLAQNSLNNAADKMFQARKEISDIVQELSKEYDRVKKSADQLGVDINTTQVGKNFGNAFETIDHWANRAETIQRQIEKFKI